MKTLRLSAAVLLLSGSVAFAQTTPLNPIAAIIGPESSNCTNNYNLISTATGCGQMLQGTWDQIAPQIGVNTAQYPQMASAPPSD
jgi:muramidase (phage lysozyme)